MWKAFLLAWHTGELLPLAVIAVLLIATVVTASIASGASPHSNEHRDLAPKFRTTPADVCSPLPGTCLTLRRWVCWRCAAFGPGRPVKHAMSAGDQPRSAHLFVRPVQIEITVPRSNKPRRRTRQQSPRLLQ